MPLTPTFQLKGEIAFKQRCLEVQQCHSKQFISLITLTLFPVHYPKHQHEITIKPIALCCCDDVHSQPARVIINVLKTMINSRVKMRVMNAGVNLRSFIRGSGNDGLGKRAENDATIRFRRSRNEAIIIIGYSRPQMILQHQSFAKVEDAKLIDVEGRGNRRPKKG